MSDQWHFQKYRQRLSSLPAPAKKAIFLLLAALGITALVFCITTEHLYLSAMQLLQHPYLLLLNLLPVAAALLLVCFLSGRCLFSVSLTAAIAILLAVSHRIKDAMRQEPLLPSDLGLAKEALAIVKTFPAYQLALIALLLLFLLGLLIFCFWRGDRPQYPLPLRLICAATAFFCILGIQDAFYADKNLYESYPTWENANIPRNQYAARGFLYSFAYQYASSRLHSPAEYHAAAFAALEDTDWVPPEGAEPLDAQYPHIVMIMGEAFSDISENPHLDFSDHRDPLENWKAICAEADTVSGHIIVPGFGGGTSDTEYDVLTGCGTRYLDSTQPSYSLIHQPFDAIPYQCRLLGYETLAIHPGNAWFYNRDTVYPYLGFENCYFLEDSFDLQTQGIAGYINEEATFDKIIETLDTHIREADTPLFSFTVTIQNHGPYDQKFGYLPQNFSCDVPLDDNWTDLLTQYFHGISIADAQIGRLKEYAEASEEPIILVYFGDHLPGIPGISDFFREMDYPINAAGSAEEQLGLYETPYFIWRNDAAKALDARTPEEISFPQDGRISAQFLGTTLLELYLPQYQSELHRYNDRLRQLLPVCTEHIYLDREGNALSESELSPAELDMVTLLKNWQYYKLHDQKSLPQSPYL